MDLNEITIFAKVAQTGSFVGAARELGMPKSTVSRKVADLEARLGARLLQRTTRTLRLTDVGRVYFEHARRLLEELEEAELAVTRMQESPRGLLRVTAPLNFGFLGAMLASFLVRYPDVELEMECSDRLVNLVEDGFDVAIRAGRLADSTLVARNLGSISSFVVGSPQFWKQQGVPDKPQDLARLPCVAFSSGSTRSTWELHSRGASVIVRTTPRMTVNNFDMLRDAAIAGVGAALLPVHRCVDELRSGELLRVLPDWVQPATPLHAVYPSIRHLSPKVRALLDHLADSLSPAPWDVGPHEQ